MEMQEQRKEQGASEDKNGMMKMINMVNVDKSDGDTGTLCACK